LSKQQNPEILKFCFIEIVNMPSKPDAGVPIELYSLVFRFLKDTGLSQTAEIFKKETNKVRQRFFLPEIRNFYLYYYVFI
jgi:hypothetical protein